ncbi:MAG: phosphatidylserine decarboxylase [Hydrogenophilales bacterium 16-64-46]|nr:MAG: phosphatidylserine decarboxylase [Hydrogenophilales bacterium 12-64-13]OYZ04693.1 MAG: phosphatidylserine decarboxylase [Hydrogenophilales bacterium 16-64-46]OZA38379.1 MAG: phosphatidylserine decarboxylase [Hydrogenophilales bacterium 17-64-34]HQS99737.1 phosphatidylserine decarboxylase [Thiobacillus sp.]
MKNPLIAREGWLVLLAAFAAALVATWLLGWWSVPFWIWAVFALQFFRDPVRVPPSDADAVIAPADGRIVVVEKVRDTVLDRDALKISVFMNVFNVHSNKSPVDGVVKGIWYTPGLFVNADLDKASTENERNAIHIATARGDVTCVQIAGLIARRILCYTRIGDTLSRGQRYGFIRFGSRVDVYLPVSARPEVSIGQKVTGGRTILARW